MSKEQELGYDVSLDFDRRRFICVGSFYSFESCSVDRDFAQKPRSKVYCD
jgi:hypothetical protein